MTIIKGDSDRFYNQSILSFLFTTTTIVSKTTMTTTTTTIKENPITGETSILVTQHSSTTSNFAECLINVYLSFV